MSTLSYKTVSANKQTVQKEWVLVDAENQTVGRLATRVANILRGKTKPCYTPHVDCGDNVIIINAEKIVFTGKKMTDKIYQRYTGYPGGQRETTPAKVLASHPVPRFLPAIPSAFLNTPSVECFLKTVWEVPCTATFISMRDPSIPIRVRIPK